MRTRTNLLLLTFLLLGISFPKAQSQNMLPSKVSNFNFGTVGNGHNSNNPSSFGVSTDYIYTKDNNGLHPDDATGKFAVGTDANYYNHFTNWLGQEMGFFHLTDHTSGSGNYMIVNGSTEANKKVWEYTVNNITPGVIYEFNAFVTCLFYSMTGYQVTDIYKPKLQLKINDQKVGERYTVPWVEGGDWTLWHNTWTAGSSTTSAKITIINECTTDNGNDFGLDDLSFKMVPGYSVQAHTIYSNGCTDSYAPIDVLSHVDITEPAGQSYLPTVINIKGINDTIWSVGSSVINASHGTAYVGSDNKIHYTPHEGYTGGDRLQYRVQKYGIVSSTKDVYISVRGVPSNIVIHGLAGGQWCKDDNPLQLWMSCSTNGSDLSDTLWQWSFSLEQPQWNTMNVSTFFNNPECHDYYLRCRVQNDCGTSFGEPVLLRVCDKPVLNKTTISNPPVLCGQAVLPNDYLSQITVQNWNNDVGTAGWIVSHNNGGSWVPLTETSLQNGDKLRYKASNCCDDVYSDNTVTISVQSGPTFTQNTPSFEPYYCVGDHLYYPAAPSFNSNGLTIHDNYWVYSSDGGMTFNPIPGTQELDADWDGYQICYQLSFQCGSDVGYINSPQPFELTVYDVPQFSEPLAEIEQSFCAGDELSTSILVAPSCSGSPGLAVAWQISSGTSPTGFSTLTLPRVLTRSDNGKWIRCYATSDCGNQPSNAVQIQVNDVPSLNITQISAPDVICSGGTLSQSYLNQVNVVNWNGDEGVSGWWIKHPGGNWDTLTVQTIPQDGDLVRFVASNICGSTPTASATLSVTDGPVVQSTPSFEPFYCVGDVLSFPTPPEYNANGLTVLNGSSFWAYSDDDENYYPISPAQVLSEEWNGRKIRYHLAFQCAGEVIYAYSPNPVTLTVYGEPSMVVPETFPAYLDAVCPGTMLSDVIPDGFAPDGASHYEAYGWEISTSPSATSFTKVNNPQSYALSASHDECWIRFYVEGCGDAVTSELMQLSVGDAPSLSANEITLPMDVCDGTPLASLVSAGFLPDIHVVDWHQFDDPDDPEIPSEERWEVFYNGQWRSLTTFNLAYNGCLIRYYACNRCGVTEVVSSNPVSVIVGPSFTSSAPLQFEDTYCVSDMLVFPPAPAYNDPNNNISVGYWAYSYDGAEYHEIIEPNPVLTEAWRGRLITYVLESNCGGKNPYPEPFLLYVVGDPEVLSVSVDPDTLCEGSLLSNVNVEVNWNYGQDDGSSWYYSTSSDSYNLVDFDPENDVLPVGVNYVFYRANNGCNMPDMSDPVTVVVKGLPAFVNDDPIALGGFCVGEEITLPQAPAYDGDIEGDGVWQISVTQQQQGSYVDFVNRPLTMDDNGKWLKYSIYGCNGEPVSKYGEIHVMDLPKVKYSMSNSVCRGQLLSIEVVEPPVDVDEVLWKYIDGQGHEFQFDPSVDPFNVLGDFYVTYAPVNHCSETDPEFSEPYHVQVVQGPEFASVSWPDPVVVCEGQSLSEILSDHHINVPGMADPTYLPTPQSLGWFIKSLDENNTLQYTPCPLSQVITASYSGASLCYGMMGDCSATPIYSSDVTIQVQGRPEIVSLSMSQQFCSGDRFPPDDFMVNIDSHNSGYESKWQWNEGNGWSDVPGQSFVVDNGNDGMQVRYCVASNDCDFTPDFSTPVTLHVSGTPEILDNINESFSVCEDGALVVATPDVEWHNTLPEEGIWQVSPSENGVYGTGPFGADGLMFDMDHVAMEFNGWYLRYHVVGCNGENNSNAAKITVHESQDVQLTGTAQVAVMNSFWPGVYYYYTEVEGGGLNWTLTPPIWPIQDTIIDGKCCCMIRVTCKGQAVLSAYVGDGSCGADQFAINASSFDVDENEMPKLSVYPNPAQHSVNVVSEDIETVVVYDLLGQRLKTVAGNGDSNVSFSVDDLSEALYIIEVNTRKGSVRKPVSVTH